MAKELMIIGIIVSILLIFAFAGVPTTSNQLLGKLGITPSTIDSTNPNDLGSGLQSDVALILVASVGAGLIAGLILRNSIESSIIASLCSLLMGWIISDAISIIKFFKYTTCYAGSGCEWVGNLILFFMTILIVTTIISTISFWRGNDY